MPLNASDVLENDGFQSDATLFFLIFLASAVELNETGFKFVRKCINYIETKGKEFC